LEHIKACLALAHETANDYSVFRVHKLQQLH